MGRAPRSPRWAPAHLPANSYLFSWAKPNPAAATPRRTHRSEVRTPSLLQQTPKLTAMFRSTVCADDGSSCDIPVPLSLYKPRHRQSPFPSTRTSSHRRVIAALPLGSSKLPSPPPLRVLEYGTAPALSHPYLARSLVAGSPGGTAAARRRSLSPFQEDPVRALHVPRSARAVAALPSALGEIPMPRAFRFAASGRFSWSVERSRVVARSSVHMFM